MHTIVRRPFSAPLRALLFVGPAILLLVGVANANTPAGVIVVLAAVVVLVVVTFFSGVRLRAGERGVAVALIPFWGKRVRWDELHSVDVEEVRPFEDFGGWGIKGSHKRYGILFSAGETTTVRLTTTDGRRYLVGVGDAAPDTVRTLQVLAPTPTSATFVA